MRVLILGGGGVFGSRLARMLLEDGHDVVVAGRRGEALAPLVDAGAEAQILDIRADDLAPVFRETDVVVDAVGPFQSYGVDPYRVARAAIKGGCHYLDLSDDGAFSAGIETLDQAARAAGVVVLSGVSSVPALSSAIAADLVGGFDDIHLIESAILPGNRAPRGLSVIRAILSQAGRPVTVLTDGHEATVPGWGQLDRLALPGLGRRWASPIGAPDLQLFGAAFGARSLRFRAGLELSMLHLGLWLLAFLPRLWVLRSLEPLARPLRAVAAMTERFGSDRGGMLVRVVGRGTKGQALCRDWSVVAEAGDGPWIPAVPGRIVVDLLEKGTLLPGARPCLAVFGRAEAEAALGRLRTRCASSEVPVLPVFQEALGAGFGDLPGPVRDLHMVLAYRRWQGCARVDRGTGLLSRVICRLTGFPPASKDVPVSVTMARTGDREVWVRDFGGRRFRSVLRVDGPTGSGLVRERFGPLSFRIGLQLDEDRLSYPVLRGFVLGVPLPRWLLPVSATFEGAEGEAATFDVGISLPYVGLLVRYRGRIEGNRQS